MEVPPSIIIAFIATLFLLLIIVFSVGYYRGSSKEMRMKRKEWKKQYERLPKAIK